MTDEFKALTVVNLPFTDKRYEPGATISRSAFEAEAEAAAAAHVVPDGIEDASHPLAADEQIDYFKEWGTISDDMDAPLHPDHIPADPNRPSLAALVSQAQTLVEELEAAGADVPAKLRALAEISDRQISSVENAVSNEGTGGEGA